MRASLLSSHIAAELCEASLIKTFIPFRREETSGPNVLNTVALESEFQQEFGGIHSDHTYALEGKSSPSEKKLVLKG